MVLQAVTFREHCGLMSARRRPPVHSLAFDARTVVGCKMASHMPLVVDDSFVAFYDVGVTIG